MKYPSSSDVKFVTCSSNDFPNVPGVIANVYDIPSCACSNGILATEFSADNAPFVSRQCNGFAPGPNGAYILLPSGVFPVFFPYTTFDVIVNTDNVTVEFLYV